MNNYDNLDFLKVWTISFCLGVQTQKYSESFLLLSFWYDYEFKYGFS